ncbi:MAG: DUF1501 domain-containing protein, partial [Deltaproteobacteria bacterium]
MPPTRRELLQNAAIASALAAMGWRPRMARAAAGDRKFIFFFASGAWDTTAALDPHHGSDGVDMDPDTWTETVGGLSYTAGDDRPAISRFFQRWGDRAAIINGIDHHTVGHDNGRQMTMTGTSSSSFADWPTIIAAHGNGDYPLPHVVFSGPAYAGTLGGTLVRAGGGTLLDLIDGSIVGYADEPAPQLATPADRMVDAFVHRRASAFHQERAGGSARTAERTEALLSNLERGMELEGRRFEAGLDDLGRTLLEQSIKASELMRLGLSRCAMIDIPGGWDCHGDVAVNAAQYDDFFDALDQLMEHLATTPGQSMPWLVDEVVVVAWSEFGRTPLVNGSGGKDHWP